MDGKLIAFYRLDTGEKLLIPDELVAALHQQTAARQQAEARAERLALRLRELGEDPETL